MGGIEKKFRCPECGRKALSWNITEGVGYCFVCEKARTPEEVRHKKVSQEWGRTLSRLSQPRNEKTPVLASGGDAIFPDLLRLFFCSRGWSEIPTWSGGGSSLENLAVDTPSLRVGFPVAPSGMRIWRHVFPEKKGWKRDEGLKGGYYAADNLGAMAARETRRLHVCLVEGILDAIAVQSYGSLLHSVIGLACLGTNFPIEVYAYLLQHNPESVLLWPDPDEAGRAAIKKWRKALSPALFPRVGVIRSELEPADYVAQGRGDEVEKIINQAIDDL